MEIIPGINRNPSSTTEFLANFFKEEIGEDLLNALTQSNQNYLEMLAAVKEMKQSRKVIKEDDYYSQTNESFVSNQTDDMLKKISLECERIRAITDSEIKKEALDKLANKIADLETNILEGQKQKFDGQEEIKKVNLDLAEMKYLETKKNFIEELNQLEKKDFNKINRLITGQDDIKEKLQAVVNQIVNHDSVKDITSYFAYSLAQKELVAMLTTYQASLSLREELAKNDVNLSGHFEYFETNRAKERYLDAANGVLYYFLENDKLIDNKEFIEETSVCMTDDVKVIEEGYRVLLNGISNRLKEEQLDSFSQIKENKKMEVTNYMKKSRPEDVNHPHPYQWRFTTTMVLADLDKIMNELNIKPTVPEKSL